MNDKQPQSEEAHKQKDRLYHNAVASEYDEVIVKPRRFTNDLIFKSYRKYLKQGKMHRALDLGCGTGHMTLRFDRYFDSVDAVDGSEAMLAQAKNNLADSPADIDFIRSDFVDFLSGAHDGRYDAVFCTGFLHHLKSAELNWLLSELHRVLRNGGFVLISEPIKISDETPSEIAEWNAKAQSIMKPYSPEVHALGDEHLDTDEEPLDRDWFVGLLGNAGFRPEMQTQSWEIYPQDTSFLRNYLSIRKMFNRSLGTGNVFTILAFK
ncbi:MAG: class I SAM-dependent methyltransferase [Thermoleophilia bacterium]